jgi:hypothetical protein
MIRPTSARGSSSRANWCTEEGAIDDFSLRTKTVQYRQDTYRQPLRLRGMKRRQALLSVCTAVASVGCLGWSTSQSQEPRLAWIWLLNDRDEPYEVDVIVEDGDDTVFSESYELGTEPDTANIHEDNPVDGTGHYVVRATMDGETRGVDTTDVVDGDENCIGVRFSLLNNGSVDYWMKSMQQC